MALMDKYKDLFALANQIGLKNPDVKEEGGKLKISGQTQYQLDANRLWDNIKTHAGWENEIVANIQAQQIGRLRRPYRRLRRHAVEAGEGIPRRLEALHGHLQRQRRTR